jgi:hypothetical protein
LNHSRDTPTSSLPVPSVPSVLSIPYLFLSLSHPGPSLTPHHPSRPPRHLSRLRREKVDVVPRPPSWRPGFRRRDGPSPAHQTAAHRDPTSRRQRHLQQALVAARDGSSPTLLDLVCRLLTPAPMPLSPSQASQLLASRRRAASSKPGPLLFSSRLGLAILESSKPCQSFHGSMLLPWLYARQKLEVEFESVERPKLSSTFPVSLLDGAANYSSSTSTLDSTLCHRSNNLRSSL